MMKYAIIHSAICNGLEMQKITIEISILKGMPRFEISGLNSRKGNEIFSRIRAALQNNGFQIPQSRIICNIYPEMKQNDANTLDLAIAIAILLADAQINYQGKDPLFILGGLSLSGKVESVPGVYAVMRDLDPMQYLMIIPTTNQGELIEAKLYEQLFFAVKNIMEAVDIIENKRRDLYQIQTVSFRQKQNLPDALIYIQQPMAYRAMEIAIAGWHPFLMIGSPGSGKTTLAKQMQYLLPEPDEQVKAEIYKLYSVRGIWSELYNFQIRPFVMAHQMMTMKQLLGDAQKKIPGLCSMANEGILFLDELNLFKKETLQALRRPMLEKKIDVFQDNMKISFPANFLLVATMNPCPCGFLFESRNLCSCKKSEIDRFQAKITGALYDRFQIVIAISNPKQEEVLSHQKPEDITRHFASIKKHIAAARERQIFRQRKEAGDYRNGCLSIKNMTEQFNITDSLLHCFEQEIKTLHISSRAYIDLLRVARTIADIEQSDFIKMEHLDEAVFFRRQIMKA